MTFTITDLRTQLAELQARHTEVDEAIKASYATQETYTESGLTWRKPSEHFTELWDIEKQIKDLERDLKGEEADRGTPATYAVGSDRYAGEIVKVEHYKSGANQNRVRVITFQFTTKGGLNGRIETFRKNKHGYWKATGSTATLHIGYAEDYRDPHF